MAKDLGDLIVKLSLDSSKFNDGIAKFQAQMTQLQNQYRSSTSGVTDFDKVTTKLQGSAKTLTDRLDAQRVKVANLEAQYQKSVEAKGADAAATQKLKDKLDAAKEKLSQTETALKLVNDEIAKNQNSWYQLSVNLKGVGDHLKEVGDHVSDAGEKLSTHLTAPIVALGTAGVAAFMNLDEGLDTIAKKTGASGEALSGMEDVAVDLFTSMAVSMDDAGTAVGEVNTRFDATGDRLEMLTASFLRFAEVNDTDVNDAIDSTARILEQFGLDVSDTDGLLGMLTATGQKTGLTMSDLMGILEANSATLKALGFSAEESINLIAQMELAGVDSSTAMAGLKKAVMNLTDSGMSLDDALSTVISSIKNASSETEALSIAQEVFGTKGAAEMATAIREGRFSLDDLSDSMGNYAGVVGTTFDTLMDSSDNATVAFNKIKNAGRVVGEAVLNALVPALEKVAAMVASVGAWFESLDPRMQTTLVTIGAIVAAIGPALVIGGKVFSAIGTIMGVLSPLVAAIGGVSASTGALGAVMTALSGPIGIVIAAVAALVAVFVTLYNNNEAFRNKVNALWGSIVAAMEPVKQAFFDTFDKIKASMEPMKERLGELWLAVQDSFSKIWNLVEPIVIALGATIGAFIATVIASANGILNAIGPLVDALIAAADFVMNILGAITAFVRGDFTGAWDSLKAALGSLNDFWVAVFTSIREFFVGFWNAIVAIASGFGIDLNAVISDAWNGIKGFLTDTWNTISSTAGSIWSGITNAVSLVVGNCKAAIAGAWNEAKEAITSTWNAISGAAADIWNSITGSIGDAVDSVKTAVSEKWTATQAAVVSIWNGLKTSASTIWNSMTSSVSDIVSVAKTAITDKWNAISESAKSVWNLLKTTASTTWSGICGAVEGAVAGAKTTITDKWDTISEGVRGVWETLKGKASPSWSGITDTVKSAVDAGKSGIVSAWEGVKSGVQSAWDKVLDIIKSPINTAQSWLQEKVDYFKNLFNFTWKLPDFKLPKINVAWSDVGWGIKIPSLSLSWNALGGIFNVPTIFATANAGLQGVGEAGPEAILPLNTLWAEMSVRLKQGMRDILNDSQRDEAQRDERLVRAFAAALSLSSGTTPSGGGMNITQNIYANETSYVGQQREAARNFKQIARSLA